MGRGSLYHYDHFMLLDPDKLVAWQDEDGRERYPDAEEYAEAWKDFELNVCELLKATPITNRRERWNTGDNEAYHFGETDRCYLGIDTGGGAPCLFMRPKCWSRYRCDDCSPFDFGYNEDVPYVLNRDADRGFNRLIRAYPEGFFSFPTTAWTSFPYGRAGRTGKLWSRYNRVVHPEDAQFEKRPR